VSNIPDLIKFIKNSVNRKNQLIKNLQKIIEIEENYEHDNAINWANWELNGYVDKESIPHYRKINIFVQKHSSSFIAERKYEKSEYFSKPIKEVIENSKKDLSTYNTTNIWGTPLTHYIQKSEFLEIIEGVKRKIKEYISKILKDPDDIEADFSFIVEESYREYQSKLKQEKFDLLLGKLDLYLKDEKEKDIFSKNLSTLLKFEYDRNYKFCMILMGAILEFLLVRYCRNNDIPSEPYKNRKGDTFANYIEAAIKNDIFGEKMRWVIVQSHLRNFRNFIHILKEIRSTEIDENWYDTIKPVFEVLYNKFKNS